MIFLFFQHPTSLDNLTPNWIIVETCRTSQSCISLQSSSEIISIERTAAPVARYLHNYSLSTLNSSYSPSPGLAVAELESVVFWLLHSSDLSAGL